jgi:hypothetical protein
MRLVPAADAIKKVRILADSHSRRGDRAFGDGHVKARKGLAGLFGRKQKSVTEAPAAVTPLTELFSAHADDMSGGKDRLPRFKATAADRVERRGVNRLTTLRIRLSAAFTPSQPVVSREKFAGRAEALGSVISSIEDQRLHLVLYGPRGIGKTSLLHILAEAATEARYIVHYSSCGAASNFSETFRSAAADIPLLFHSGFGPTAEEAEAGATLADLLPADVISPRQFGEVCAKLAGTRVIIILDEFERSEALEFRRDIAELIKILSDRSVRVQLVIAGVAGDVAELVEHIPSIRRNILAIRLPLMADEEARELVKIGETASGITFDPAAREFIVKIAAGWPYIASLLAHHSGLSALNADRTTVLAEDVAEALDGALGELAGRVSKRQRARAEQLMATGVTKVLGILARGALKGGGEFAIEDLEAIAGGTAEGAAAKRLTCELAREGLLLKERTEQGGGVVYGFVEDGLAALLWFYAVRAESFATQTARAS